MNKKIKVYPLKIEDIVYPRKNFNEYYSQDELIALVNRIKNGEEVNPIIVKFSAQGYEIVKGSIILEAYKLLDKKIIPAYIQR